MKEKKVKKKVTAYLNAELYDIYDEAGHFIEGGFSQYEDLEQYCKDNNLKLVELFNL